MFRSRLEEKLFETGFSGNAARSAAGGLNAYCAWPDRLVYADNAGMESMALSA